MAAAAKESGAVQDERLAFDSGGQTRASAGSPSQARAATAVLGDDRKLVKTASVDLQSHDVDRVLGTLNGVVATHRGIVESEDVRTDDDGAAESATVVLRVPVDRFDTAVADIADLARLVHKQTSSVDVTARVADVSARVASAERSIAQLRQLFSRAGKLGEVIALESQLSERQAQLEALQARQRSLARQTSLSTIYVSLTTPDPAPGPRDARPAGFVAGIASGWSALVTFVRGAAHLLGLVLPFGVLALLVALPTWIALRRMRVTRGRTAE